MDGLFLSSTHPYLGQMDSKNTHLLLFSVVFLLLGFLLGSATAPKHPHPHHGKRGGMKWSERGKGAGHEVDVRVLTKEDLIKWSVSGELNQ